MREEKGVSLSPLASVPRCAGRRLKLRRRDLRSPSSLSARQPLNHLSAELACSKANVLL